MCLVGKPTDEEGNRLRYTTTTCLQSSNWPTKMAEGCALESGRQYMTAVADVVSAVSPHILWTHCFPILERALPLCYQKPATRQACLYAGNIVQSINNAVNQLGPFTKWKHLQSELSVLLCHARAIVSTSKLSKGALTFRLFEPWSHKAGSVSALAGKTSNCLTSARLDWGSGWMNDNPLERWKLCLEKQEHRNNYCEMTLHHLI